RRRQPPRGNAAEPHRVQRRSFPRFRPAPRRAADRSPSQRPQWFPLPRNRTNREISGAGFFFRPIANRYAAPRSRRRLLDLSQDAGHAGKALTSLQSRKIAFLQNFAL